MAKNVIIRKWTWSWLLSHANKFWSVAKELSNETGISRFRLILDMVFSLLRYGATEFDYKAYRFYERNHFSRNRFLTGRRRFSIANLFNPKKYHSLYDNKNEFYRCFSDFLGRRWLYAPDASDQQIEEFLSGQKQVIVKPFVSFEGIGIYKLAYSEVADMKVFCESAREKRLTLEEIIKQHPDLNSINSASVNTLRVNTVMDKKGIPHILCASIRMGIGQSIVDNISSGGIYCQIDLETGIVFTPAVGEDLQTHIRHPTSGVVLPGFQIPYWEAAKAMVLSAAKVTPQTRWVGWDVAITSEGPLLVEGNTRPGPITMQLAVQTGIYHIVRRYL